MLLDPEEEAYPFFRVHGEEVHEVAVGPVHAGIIEPGHFRFQAHGEEVLFLEIMLGYQHRGVECLLERVSRNRAVLVAESIAGDTVIGHAGAYCGAIEALARSRKTPRAQSIRGISLELERLANHIGDLGAMASDVAFQPAAAFFGRMRGVCLNLLMAVSGNRYGRGLIRPGGVSFDITPSMIDEMRNRLERLAVELEPVVTLMFQNASVQSRLEGVGAVPGRNVSSWDSSARSPAPVTCVAMSGTITRTASFALPTSRCPRAWAGDVLARALVRRLEIRRSLEFVLDQLGQLPRGEVRVPCAELRPNEIVVALTEGWRGEIAHIVITDDRGRIRRHKIIDPSFRNWTALALALPGNQISDFPLCNKSFNLSYAGHDL